VLEPVSPEAGQGGVLKGNSGWNAQLRKKVGKAANLQLERSGIFTVAILELGFDPPNGFCTATGMIVLPGSTQQMMDLAIIFLILIASGVVVMFVFGPRKFRQRAKLISDYAQNKGYVLANPSLVQIATTSSARELITNPSLRSFIKGSEGIADIEGLERGTDDPFAVICNLRSKEVMIFDFSVDSQRTDDRAANLNYKVAKIRSVGLPRFSLGRNSVVHTVQNVVDNMVGKPKSDIHLDPRNADPNIASEFEKHFWLKGSDCATVSTFLSSAKLQFLENAKLPGVIATNAHYMVYFEDGSLGSATDFDLFIATAEKIVVNLL
jgi:hypothetical protein